MDDKLVERKINAASAEMEEAIVRNGAQIGLAGRFVGERSADDIEAQ